MVKDTLDFNHVRLDDQWVFMEYSERFMEYILCKYVNLIHDRLRANLFGYSLLVGIRSRHTV